MPQPPAEPTRYPVPVAAGAREGPASLPHAGRRARQALRPPPITNVCDGLRALSSDAR
jgi:hypothetical protein